MTLSRLCALTLFATAGFGLAHRAATAQDQPLPTKKSAATEAVNTFKEAKGIATEQLPEVRKEFQTFAAYFGAMIKHPLVYRHAQDPSIRAPNDRVIPPLEGVNGIIPDLQRFILEPNPKSGIDKYRGDYIRELGTAIDAVLKPIITENPETIVQINATRMLAAACKSGATAHYPTVIELLRNANTPPHIRLYALQAAGNLLSAYDVYDIRSRRHSNGWKNQQTKGAGDKELAELVVEIEKSITNPAAILSNVTNFKIAEITPDQVEVVRFIRRQAIRALAEVRFVAIPGPDGKSTLYPAYTLARVCVSDPALGVSPSPSECAEAAMGICNMSIVRESDYRKDYDVDTAAEAVVTAVVTFSEPRARDAKDKSLDWRGYGLRLAEALKNWRYMFDVTYNPLQPASFSGTVPPAVDNLVQRVQVALLNPLDSGGSIAVEDLRSYLKTLRDRKDQKPLFTSVPATALHPQSKK